MKDYLVSTETFAAEATEFERIPPAVEQLVQRYGIRNKSILSLGSRFGREEYWFTKHGNRLTLVDIDEQGDLDPILKAAAPGPLHYIIGDATTVPLSGPFDVLFLSGYGPDDLRRSTLKIDYQGKWPEGTAPFHHSVIDRARLLAPNGLILIQSYANGYDVMATPGFLEHCDRQLAANGLRLVELYTLAEVRGCNLFVIAKGAPVLSLACPITLFHGRGTASDVVPLRTEGIHVSSSRMEG